MFLLGKSGFSVLVSLSCYKINYEIEKPSDEVLVSFSCYTGLDFYLLYKLGGVLVSLSCYYALSLHPR